MRILEISDFQKTGGASIAASRITRSIRDHGHQVIRSSSDSLDPNFALFQGRKASFLNYTLEKIGLHSLRSKVLKKDILKQFQRIAKVANPNCILFHNLHGASWPQEMVLQAAKSFPTSWTLHDCSSFLSTYYPSHCSSPTTENFRECQNFWDKIERSKHIFPLHGVTPSNWLKKEATYSYWGEDSVVTIHNPIPDSFFEPRDSDSCKKALHLNPEKRVVLVVAGDLKEERKGGLIIKELISSFKFENIQLLLVGSGFQEGDFDQENIKCLGIVKDEVTLQIAYHAADLLFHPAPVDNLPNTVAEAMSCGTPVLAFQTGGLPEMIIHGETGWLVKKIDNSSILKTLKEIISAPIGANFGKASRVQAKKLFDSQTIGKKYLDHLSKLIFREIEIAQKNRK
jgi:glycosyltransferase involved in cell wall biosynthesis